MRDDIACVRVRERTRGAQGFVDRMSPRDGAPRSSIVAVVVVVVDVVAC